MTLEHIFELIRDIITLRKLLNSLNKVNFKVLRNLIRMKKIIFSTI